MADGINYTGDLPRDQVDISTDNRSIFYRVCDVADCVMYIIPEYTDDAMRTAI